MPTIFIRMMFCCESCIFYVYLLQRFRLHCFFLVHRKNYSLILNYKAKSCLFPLVAACTSCEYLNGFSGFFSTPNFPSNYPQYNKCIWNITVPSGYIIKLSFLYFRLEPHQYTPCYDASEARVTVTNVASDNHYYPFTLCGQSLPSPVYSVGNSVSKQRKLVSWLLTRCYVGRPFLNICI